MVSAGRRRRLRPMSTTGSRSFPCQLRLPSTSKGPCETQIADRGGNPFDTGEITVGADGIRRYGIAHFPRGDAGYARCRPSDGRGHRRRLSYQWLATVLSRSTRSSLATA
jgi:hypothetical protein